ncbi:hypothetical protein FKM82_002721 [Ascaphus truei]
MMIFMLANTIASIITSVTLNIVDKRQGGALNKMTKRTSASNQEAGEESDRSPILNQEEDQRSINLGVFNLHSACLTQTKYSPIVICKCPPTLIS